MRMMMKASFPIDAGNKGVTDGTLPETVMKFVETMKPEASYFIAEGGQRTAILVLERAPGNLAPLPRAVFSIIKRARSASPAESRSSVPARPAGTGWAWKVCGRVPNPFTRSNTT